MDCMRLLIQSSFQRIIGSMHKPTDSIWPNQRACSGANHSLPIAHPTTKDGSFHKEKFGEEKRQGHGEEKSSDAKYIPCHNRKKAGSPHNPLCSIPIKGCEDDANLRGRDPESNRCRPTTPGGGQIGRQESSPCYGSPCSRRDGAAHWSRSRLPQWSGPHRSSPRRPGWPAWTGCPMYCP